jgi:hypothetical protein
MEVIVRAHEPFGIEAMVVRIDNAFKFAPADFGPVFDG